MVANDDDNSLRGQVYSLPLPADPGARARAVLGKLLDLYAADDSNHPISGGAASVAQVFLLPAAGGSVIDAFGRPIEVANDLSRRWSGVVAASPALAEELAAVISGA